jgi:hypothetical protein
LACGWLLAIAAAEDAGKEIVVLRIVGVGGSDLRAVRLARSKRAKKLFPLGVTPSSSMAL